ncbi:MAG: serine/threonine protein kinase, partial [Bdellovibrionales bacterium]|nr:serine/threonine protein kinase [Bdellovibrionales bacterium]
SVVYKARLLDPVSTTSWQTASVVALKVLTGSQKSNEESVRRMKREALALLSARHENVVRLYDYVIGDDLCYLVMEYADLGDLGAELEISEYPMDPQIVVPLARQLAAALHAVHHAGILHRDIKPENILLTSHGKVKLTDFSIAMLPTEAIPYEDTRKGVGTFEYLAPEYLSEGRCDRTTDIYSVGVTLFQLLTKQFPFAGATLAEQIDNKMQNRRLKLANILTEYPAGLDAVLDRALAHDPADRFQSAEELLDALEAIDAENLVSGPLPPEPVEETTPETLPPSVEQPQSVVPSGEYRYHKDTLSASENILSRARSAEPSAAIETADLIPATTEVGAEFRGSSTQLREMYERLTAGSSDRSAVAGIEGASRKKVSTRGRFAFYVVFGIFLCLLGIVLYSFQEYFEHVLQGPPAPTTVASGSLSGLLESGDDIPLLVERFRNDDRSRYLVTVGIPGWIPHEVDARAWESARPVEVMSGGVRIELKPDGSSSEGTARRSGSFTDLDSGLSGKWYVE